MTQKPASHKVSESVVRDRRTGVDSGPIVPGARREFLTRGATAALGLAATGAIAATLLSRPATAQGCNLLPASNNTCDLGENGLAWRHLYFGGPPLRLMERTVDGAGEVEFVNHVIDDPDLPGEKIAAPIFAWDVRLRNAAVRTFDKSGFREIHFHDSAYAISEDAHTGRFADLVAERAEFTQYNYVQHFMGGDLPVGWTESVAGTGIDGETLGIREVPTKSGNNQVGNTQQITMKTRDFALKNEVHAEWYLRTWSNSTTVRLFAGFADSNLTDVASVAGPANAIGFRLMDGTANWDLVAKDGGTLRAPVATTLARAPQRRFFRSEFWRANEGGGNVSAEVKALDRFELFHGDTFLGYFAAPNINTLKGAAVKPVFAVQTTDSSKKTLQVDLFKAYHRENYRLL